MGIFLWFVGSKVFFETEFDSMCTAYFPGVVCISPSFFTGKKDCLEDNLQAVFERFENNP